MVASRFLRSVKILDPSDPSSYKRFAQHPKSDTSYILFRGDTRDPDMIKQGGGFFPQPGRSNVSDSGASTSMVSLTLDPSVAATYYAFVRNYYKNPTKGATNEGYIYAVFLPTGRGIMNYQMAANVGSKNVGSKEVSALAVPWANVVGWRQLPEPDKCKPDIGSDKIYVAYTQPWQDNPDFVADLGVADEESRGLLDYVISATHIVVYQSNAL